MKAFTELKDIIGREIKVRSNESKRTWTIIRSGTKYRTLRMSKEEFVNTYYWNGNDWNQFLKSNEYYIVKK